MIPNKGFYLDFIAEYDIISSVIAMNILDDLVVTEVYLPIVVHSEKGRVFQMTNRPRYGLSLCMSGQITYTMNGKKYVSNETNAVLLPRGGTYSLLGDKDGFFPVLDFECENCSSSEILILPLENTQACIQNFESLKNLFLHNESKLKIFSSFYDLLSKVSSTSSQKHTPLNSLIPFIAENIQDPKLSNTDLAKQIGISEVYLRKLFLSHYQITPKQYILDIRINKAKQMLCDTPFSVASIAEECGFSSVYHFCRMFKQRTGMTPTQYTQNNRLFKI